MEIDIHLWNRSACRL